jgi:hypothetical protein
MALPMRDCRNGAAERRPLSVSLRSSSVPITVTYTLAVSNSRDTSTLVTVTKPILGSWTDEMSASLTTRRIWSSMRRSRVERMAPSV